MSDPGKYVIGADQIAAMSESQSTGFNRANAKLDQALAMIKEISVDAAKLRASLQWIVPVAFAAVVVIGAGSVIWSSMQ